MTFSSVTHRTIYPIFFILLTGNTVNEEHSSSNFTRAFHLKAQWQGKSMALLQVQSSSVNWPVTALYLV